MNSPEGQKIALVGSPTRPDDELQLVVRNAAALWADATTGTVSSRRDDILRDKQKAVADFFAFTRKSPAEVRPEDGSNCISFQQVADYRPPAWPAQDVPQQMHLDVMVRDLDRGEAAVLELGATKPDTQPGTSFRVFLDPAGHPFCLCVN